MRIKENKPYRVIHSDTKEITIRTSFFHNTTLCFVKQRSHPIISDWVVLTYKAKNHTYSIEEVTLIREPWYQSRLARFVAKAAELLPDNTQSNSRVQLSDYLVETVEETESEYNSTVIHDKNRL